MSVFVLSEYVIYNRELRHGAYRSNENKAKWGIQKWKNDVSTARQYYSTCLYIYKIPNILGIWVVAFENLDTIQYRSSCIIEHA